MKSVWKENYFIRSRLLSNGLLKDLLVLMILHHLGQLSFHEFCLTEIYYFSLIRYSGVYSILVTFVVQ